MMGGALRWKPASADPDPHDRVKANSRVSRACPSPIAPSGGKPQRCARFVGAACRREEARAARTGVRVLGFADIQGVGIVRGAERAS